MAQDNPDKGGGKAPADTSADPGKETNADGGDGEGGDIEKLVEARVNTALSTHMTRFRQSFEREFTKKMQATLGESLAPLGKQLDEFSKKIGKGSKTQQQENPPDDYSVKMEEERKKWESKMAEMEKQLNAERELRVQGETARKRDEERSLLASVLQKEGITGAKLRAAISLLYSEDKRVIRNDDGEIRFTVPKAGYIEEVSLEEGITSWLKSDEGKEFLPARGASGSGSNGSTTGRPGKGPRTKAEARALASRKLAEAMGVVPRE